MLDDTVLLWAVGRCVLMMHALSRTVFCELPHGELASAVGAECPQLQVRLAFRPPLDLLDSSRCMILGGDDGYLDIPVEVIHKQQEVLLTPWHR
jgi:hypothetical protein